MAEDGVIASLLLVHDLYPVPLDKRVMEALDQVRPYLDSHGGGVELLDVTDGVARIRLEGSCKTCPASSATLELAVKQALDEVAPDLEGLVVEGITDSEPEPATGFDLPVLQVSANGDQEDPASKTAQAQAAFNSSNGGAWHALAVGENVAEGRIQAAEVGGTALAVARIDGTLLAFLDCCPACSSPVASRHAPRRHPRLSRVRRLIRPSQGWARHRRRRAARSRPAPRRLRRGQGRTAADRMTENANGNGNGALDRLTANRKRAELVSGLRGLRAGATVGSDPSRRSQQAQTSGVEGSDPGSGVADEVCDVCGTPIAHDHRHLLHLPERRILCACEVCLAEKSAEAEYRPVGHRVTWLDDLEMADEMWARLGIPIALAFFTQNGDTGETVAFYPSPAGSTECELDLDAWADLVEANPALAELEPDAEAFIVNRMSDPAQYVIVPIDRCYEMVGAVKMAWEGISGGDEVDQAIEAFFRRLRGPGEGA